MTYDYDLFVIGGGSGGVRASRMAAAQGARVAVAEEYGFGGTCVIRGCIPKKLFVYASQFGEAFEDAFGFGWTVPARKFDWTTLVANKDKEIARLADLYRQNVTKSGAEIIMDRAELLDAHTIYLTRSKRRVTAEYILIATGGRPSRNLGDCAGSEHAITSNEAFHLERLPRRIVIAGGGYIAVEFANIFHGLGCETTLVYRGEKILRGFDEHMRDSLTEAMNNKGMRIVTRRQFRRIDKRENEFFVLTDHDEILETDCVMAAIGRLPNTDGLGLEKAGVALGAKGEVLVDGHSRTNVENIYAIGDVTDRLQLTPVAIHEAMAFVRTVFEKKPTPVDHELVPTAVFSQPEIATVGMSEDVALRKGHRIDVYLSKFRPLKHTLSGREERSLFKLVVDADTDRVLGCHIFGHDAAEIIQVVAIALKMGATKADFDATMALHPSAAEELVTMRSKSYSKEPLPA
jgi:glutathione reductase (NADPH)